MWSRAARAAERMRAQRATDEERATLVPRMARVVEEARNAAAREKEMATTTSATDRRESVAETTSTTTATAKETARVAVENLERWTTRARKDAEHLVPGVVALLACALVLWCGSFFIDHPLFKFEHRSRSLRAAAPSSVGPMTCVKNPELTGTESCLPSFAVLGSHIGGVDKLRALMTQHDMLTVGQKGLHFFNPVYGATQGVQMCDPPELLLKTYFSAIRAGHGDSWSPYDPTETMKSKKSGETFQRELGDVVTGDWSDTYFNCACCASTMKKLMPHLRPIVVLRDPVGRAMARYVQENHPTGTPVDAAGLSACALKDNDYTWADTAMKTKEYLEKCMGESVASHSETLARECLDYHSILGWSMYAEYLEIWQREFPDMLVLYADDIDENPVGVARAVEKYLGLPESKSPYDTATLGSEVDKHPGSIAFDLQLQLTKETEDREATQTLVSFFEPHVKRLHEMSKDGKIPPLPYKWLRRYSIPVKRSLVKSRKLLSDVDEDNKEEAKVEDVKLTAISPGEKVRYSSLGSSEPDGVMSVEDVLLNIQQNDNAQGEDDEAHELSESSEDEDSEDVDGATLIDQLMGRVKSDVAAEGKSKKHSHKKHSHDDIEEEVSKNSTNVDPLVKIAEDAERAQKRAEEEEKAIKPSWKSKTVRGRFYSDLYIPMERQVRDELRGKIFVPVTVPYLFQFANEFKHDKAWMDIVGIRKEEQQRVYSELWRDDCTHSQQWSAESGCCGLACCLVGGHRKETVGLHG